MIAGHLGLFEGASHSQKTWLCLLTYRFILVLIFPFHSYQACSQPFFCGCMNCWLVCSHMCYSVEYQGCGFPQQRYLHQCRRSIKHYCFDLIILASSLCKWRKWKKKPNSWKIRIFNRDYCIGTMIHVSLTSGQWPAFLYSFSCFVKVFPSLMCPSFWACQWQIQIVH